MPEKFKGIVREAVKTKGRQGTYYWVVSFEGIEDETFLCFNPNIERMVGQEIEGEITEKKSATGVKWKQFSFSTKNQPSKEEGESLKERDRIIAMMLSYAKDLSINASTLATEIVKSMIEGGLIEENAEIDLRKYHGIILSFLQESVKENFELLKKINNGRTLTSSSQED